MEIIGTIIGIFGAVKLGDYKQNMIKTNTVFGISNLFLISYFIYQFDWWMVLLQTVFLFCSFRAVVNAIKRRKAERVVFIHQQNEYLKVNI